MTTHTITAFFDDREHADEAVALLRRAGLSETDVTLSPSDARDEFATFDPLSAGLPRRKGFWGMLEDLFGGSDDHDLYAEGVRRGNTMLTAQVEDERLDDAVEILDRHGSIDLDEREVSWRNDGWLGGSVGMPSGASLAPGALGLETKAAPVIIPPVEPAPVMTPASFAVSSPVEAPMSLSLTAASKGPERVTPPPSAAATTDLRDADVLQVVEERLVVGKRAVSRGKVRVHSTVIENPVTQEVRLRDETIRVDRQMMDRAVSPDELMASGFKDRTIEMEEVDEEAVVSKTARVIEEIGLRKDVSNRTETISATVRSTRVDIADERDTVTDPADETSLERSTAAGVTPMKPI